MRRSICFWIATKTGKSKKVCSQRGETITEVLATSLIVSLALVMLASMITSSVRMVQKTKTFQENVYNAYNSYEAGNTTIIDNNISISIVTDPTVTPLPQITTQPDVNISISGSLYKAENPEGQNPRVTFYGYKNN